VLDLLGNYILGSIAKAEGGHWIHKGLRCSLLREVFEDDDPVKVQHQEVLPGAVGERAFLAYYTLNK
jgi:hypothetical protein